MKIYQAEQFDRAVVKVAFVSDENHTNLAYNFVTGTESIISYGASIPPDCIMTIPLSIWNDMLKQFAELANEKGLKLDGDLKREGKLEATERHLQDMRTLLKLK
jgi:hypothetical protein